jgi:Zn-dependent protease with chaperone function
VVLAEAARFFASPLHLNVLIVSWAFALGTFLYWRESPKARWLYAHVFFLLVPLLDFAVAVPCATPFFQGLMTFCSLTYTRLLIFLIPIALLGAIAGGYYLAPILYRRMYRTAPLHNRRLQKLAAQAGVSGVRYFVLDTAKPIAFAIRNDVHISVGMFDLLQRKEHEAVVLHELAHVRQHSSFEKFSTALARVFSPLAHFASVSERVSAEEATADAFAAKLQGTSRHLVAAQRKVRQFLRL